MIMMTTPSSSLPMARFRFMFQIVIVFFIAWIVARFGLDLTGRDGSKGNLFVSSLPHVQSSSPPPNYGILTPNQLDEYNRDGFLVLPDFVPLQEIMTLESRIESIIQSTNLTQENPSIFSTDKQKRNHQDQYFLDSAHKIGFFWEEHAFDPISGALTQDPRLSINKIGHALHWLDPTFESFTRTKLTNLTHSLGFERPAALQSMYIFKQPKIGGKVNPHTDSTFLYTEPESCVGFWLAIHDATIENGCLWVVPGSHYQLAASAAADAVDDADGDGEGDSGSGSGSGNDSGNDSDTDSDNDSGQNNKKKPRKVHSRFVKNAKGTGTMYQNGNGEPEEFDIESAVPVEVKAGTLVVLHGSLVHFSRDNTSPKPRHAYTVHVVEAAQGTVYPDDNWLEFPKDDRIFL